MANEKNLRPFRKGSDPRRNLKGQPKKITTTLKKEGLTASQVNDIIKEMLAMNKDELKNIIDNPASKSFEILIASAIFKGVSKGDLSQIFGFALNRVFGAPKQQVELKSDPIANFFNEANERITAKNI